MFRYNDGTMRQNGPAKVEYNGFIRNFHDLTREQWDELGYNEALPAEKAPFTTYTTEWVKGEDLIYREVVVSSEVDEVSKAEHEAEVIRAERDRLLVESDWTQLQDAGLDQSNVVDWQLYRQALRDVPQQAGFPGEVTWPVSSQS